MENQTETTNQETKVAKFKRIGSARLIKVLDAINNMKSLANSASYEYTEDQIVKIDELITQRKDEVLKALRNRGKAKEETKDDIL